MMTSLVHALPFVFFMRMGMLCRTCIKHFPLLSQMCLLGSCSGRQLSHIALNGLIDIFQLTSQPLFTL